MTSIDYSGGKKKYFFLVSFKFHIGLMLLGLRQGRAKACTKYKKIYIIFQTQYLSFFFVKNTS